MKAKEFHELMNTNQPQAVPLPNRRNGDGNEARNGRPREMN